MSALPRIPPAGPTLGEVLTKRMLTRPPHVFVDGDLIEALKHADAGELQAVPVAPAAEERPRESRTPPTSPTPPTPPTPRVDVRV